MTNPHHEFTQLWEEQAPRVLAFATRHVGAESAKDVVAETFTVAWRRWGTLPEPPIGWLLVTARKVIQNRARSHRRHEALAHRIALLDHVAAFTGDSADEVISRRDALTRLASLDEQHREALLLVAWDGLTNDEAASVLGIKPATFRRRISRARAALLTPSPAESNASHDRPRPRLITSQELS